MNSLKRAFRVLELLAEETKGISFNELCRRCGNLAPATMSRMLRALTAQGLLDKDKGSERYIIGGAFLSLARKSLGIQSLAEVVTPDVNRLASATGESAAFFGLEGKGMSLVAKKEIEESFHYCAVGTYWEPLPNDPFGWACLAHTGSVAAKGKVDRAQLDRIRKEGCLAAFRDMRFKALRVVAPVLTPGDTQPIGSIGITAINRPGLSKIKSSLKRKVKDAAQRLSSRAIDPAQATKEYGRKGT